MEGVRQRAIDKFKHAVGKIKATFAFKKGMIS